MTTVEINGLKDMIACNTRISSIIDDHSTADKLLPQKTPYYS